MSTYPLISVVTPCLNRAGMIAQAVESVLAQGYPQVEHIIADGGSTDGTLEVLRRYPHLRVLSEPDRGLYDALNKGIRAARGQVIGHLNSDDEYAPGVFPEVAACFAADPELDGVYGGSSLFEVTADGSRRVILTHSAPEIVRLSVEGVTTRGMPNTNARFFHRRVYDRVGFYDQDFPVAADRDFLLRAALAGLKGRCLPRIFYHYRQHPGSLTMDGTGVAYRSRVDNLRVAERALRRDGLSGRPRGTVRRWHAIELGLLVLATLRRREVGRAVGQAMGGVLVHPSWPVEFGLAGLRRLLGGRTTTPG